MGPAEESSGVILLCLAFYTTDSLYVIVQDSAWSCTWPDSKALTLGEGPWCWSIYFITKFSLSCIPLMIFFQELYLFIAFVII